MNKPVVISLCDRTGNMVKPWAEAGCECWCVDTQHSIRRDRSENVGKGVIHFVWGDVRSWRMPSAAAGRVVQFFGFPPCPHLTCTAARDFVKKGGWMLADAVQVFDACEVAATFSGAPYMIENPGTSRLNTHRRKPDYRIHPWEYAGYLTDINTDNTMKLTGLWTGGGALCCLIQSQRQLRTGKTAGMHHPPMTERTFAASPRWDSRKLSFKQITTLSRVQTAHS